MRPSSKPANPESPRLRSRPAVNRNGGRLACVDGGRKHRLPHKRGSSSRSRHPERHKCGGNRLRHIGPDDSEEVNDDSGGTASVVTYREDSVSARDQVWFARDSLLEGAVTSEPVSGTTIPDCWNWSPISMGFWTIARS